MQGKKSMLAKKRILLGGCVTALLLMLWGCASTSSQQSSEASAPLVTEEAVAGEPRESATEPLQTETPVPSAAHTAATEEKALPVRFQRPSYVIQDMGMQDEAAGEEEEALIKVGADITTTSGPVALRDILKRLAALHNMNVSWASDVDQYAYVDVDIRAEDDFFTAIEDMLRQVDYFHELKGNTIVVKFKETRKFHVALPPRIEGTTTINTSGGTTTNVVSDTTRWDSIRLNLDQVLDIWSQRYKPPPSAKPSDEEGEEIKPQGATITRTSSGFYSIDPSLGLITITAPRPLLEKVEIYIDNLKEEMYKQITIEAKILEVQLNDEHRTGIDWSELLSGSAFNFSASFGNDAGKVYDDSSFNQFLNNITMEAKNFSLILDAMSNYGDARVLSNPRISVMNGQPAVIYVGDNVTYISEVETTTDEGTVTTSATTAQAVSGLKLEVYATIMNDNEIILSLIPMISRLTEPIEYRQFGLNQIGLPEVRERTMNSIVRLKNGEMLVVGGMITSLEDTSGNQVIGLGNLPGLGKLFGSHGKSSKRFELVILLQPKIIKD
jgi:general secretion pathway protein D/MSHA biogenesis protein MshL